MCLWKKRKSARLPHHQWRHFLSFRPSEPSLRVNSNMNGMGTAAAGMAATSTSSASLSSDPHLSSEYSRGSSSPSANSAASSHIKDIISEGPSLFSFTQISQATDGFKPSNALAPSVWKGVLKSRGPVVIARKKPAAPDVLAEVLEEKLRAASSLNHFNVAKLYGLCRRRGRGDLYLVYELVEGGGSLRDCLQSKVNPGYSVLGSWRTRVQIALDVAKGLEYLHHHAAADRPFIHKHIQGDNILVTKDLRAKIAYFGLAELTGELAEDLRQMEEATVSADEEPESPDVDSPRDGHKQKRSRKVQITASQGYAPPEYLLGGVLTAKYDVYSFGVVLLELLSGKEAFSLRRDASSRKAPRTTTLAEEIHGLLDKLSGGGDKDDADSKLRLWMDSTLSDSFPMEDVLSVASIARSCVDYSPQNRPDMGYIARKLSRILSAAHKWEEARNTLSTVIVPR